LIEKWSLLPLNNVLLIEKWSLLPLHNVLLIEKWSLFHSTFYCWLKNVYQQYIVEWKSDHFSINSILFSGRRDNFSINCTMLSGRVTIFLSTVRCWVEDSINDLSFHSTTYCW
jgi:hypothetical protein